MALMFSVSRSLLTSMKAPIKPLCSWTGKMSLVLKIISWPVSNLTGRMTVNLPKFVTHTNAASLYCKMKKHVIVEHMHISEMM